MERPTGPMLLLIQDARIAQQLYDFLRDKITWETNSTEENINISQEKTCNFWNLGIISTEAGSPTKHTDMRPRWRETSSTQKGEFPSKNFPGSREFRRKP